MLVYDKYTFIEGSSLIVEFAKIEQAKQFNEERFTKIDMHKTRRSVAFLLNFLPGQHMKSHSHPQRELYLLVLDGTGTIIIDGEEKVVSEGDVIFCESDEMIGFTNTGDEKVTIYATMTKIA